MLGESSSVSQARILEQSAKLVTISLEAEPGLRTLVKLEGGDWLLLGEVIESRAGSPATVVIETAHALFGTVKLAQDAEVWSG